MYSVHEMQGDLDGQINEGFEDVEDQVLSDFSINSDDSPLEVPVFLFPQKVMKKVTMKMSLRYEYYNLYSTSK